MGPATKRKVSSRRGIPPAESKLKRAESLLVSSHEPETEPHFEQAVSLSCGSNRGQTQNPQGEIWEEDDDNVFGVFTFDGYSDKEVQQIMLAAGSKEELRLYWRLGSSTLQNLFQVRGILLPPDYARSLDLYTLTKELSERGSLEKLAERLGISVSTLKDILRTKFNEKTPVVRGVSKLALDTPPLSAEIIGKCRTVAMVKKVTDRSEREVREFIQLNNLQHLLDYSQNGHTVGTGRRAELYWAFTQLDYVTEDMNKRFGPTAKYDFYHKKFGRVNVKSSQPYKYTAKTRRSNPIFYKLGTGGVTECDVLVLVITDGAGDPDRTAGWVAFDARDVEKFGTSTVKCQRCPESGEFYLESSSKERILPKYQYSPDQKKSRLSQEKLQGKGF